MYTVDLVSSFIQSKHGWAVAEQFEATFNDEAFEEQNYNALLYIRDTVNVLLRSKLLSDDAQDELQEYVDDLEDYIMGDNNDDVVELERGEDNMDDNDNNSNFRTYNEAPYGDDVPWDTQTR